MTSTKLIWIFIGLLLATGLGISLSHGTDTPIPVVAKPALNIQVIQAERHELALSLRANGSLAAWQEAIIGAEVGGFRLAEIHAQVGDRVRKGQILALFDQERINADVAQSRAAVAEAEANLLDARLNADRVRQVLNSGILSEQQTSQYLTSEKTAEAKLRSAKAQLDMQLLRQKQTRVLASDDGIVFSRSATLGAVASEGQELFRLIRQNRLEWRAEVAAGELHRLKPGGEVLVEVPNTGRMIGKLRTVGPTVNEQNRNALIYVDLPNAEAAGFKPGMFASGEFKLGMQPALTLPQTALSIREGFSYVFRLGEIKGDVASVKQVKVELGRQADGKIEILDGIVPDDQLVASGAAFLSDGDTVRVIR